MTMDNNLTIIKYKEKVSKVYPHDMYGNYIQTANWIDSLDETSRKKLFNYFKRIIKLEGETKEKIDIILTLVSITDEKDVIDIANIILQGGESKHGDYIIRYADSIVYKRLEEKTMKEFKTLIEKYHTKADNNSNHNIDIIINWFENLKTDLRKRLIKNILWEFKDIRQGDWEIKCLKVLKYIEGEDIIKLAENEKLRVRFNDSEILMCVDEIIERQN